tara:strand:+ start:3035 stop:4888 length:1854 start_codon:yes stop_codon:yes gene_type:complete
MERAYSYIRFSSDKQAEGDSVRRQIHLRDRWLKDNPDVFLDEHTIKDFGVGAATGDNLDPKKGNLGKFLKACATGKIERGSYLIMERVDRFSRKSALKVANILVDIVEDYGLKIVFLEPSELILDSETIDDTMYVMTIVMSLQLAHDESAKKSERVAARWSDKKKNLKAGTPYTKKLPAWIIQDEDFNLEADPVKAKAIKTIFKLSVEGYGCKKILAYLNDNNIPPITEPTKRTPKPLWSLSYISQLLNDRRLIGELQPKTQRGTAHRKFDGKVIQNYFPVVIDESTFNKNILVKKERRTLKVVKNRNFINLFIGLIYCTSDGRKMTAISRNRDRYGKRTYNRFLASTGKRNGKSYCPYTIEYFKLESLLFTVLSELKVADLLIPDKSPEDLKTLYVNVDAQKERIQKLDEQIADDKNTSILETLIDAKLKAQDKLNKYKSDIEEYITPAKVHTPKDTKKLLAEWRRTLKDKKLHHELRLKMRSIIPTIVDRINLTPCKLNSRTFGFGEVVLKSGNTRRFVLHKTNVDHLLNFTDENKVPTLTIHPEGLIWNEKAIAHKDRGKKPFSIVRRNKNSEMLPQKDFNNLLDKINDNFKTADYFGESGWTSLKEHLVHIDR